MGLLCVRSCRNELSQEFNRLKRKERARENERNRILKYKIKNTHTHTHTKRRSKNSLMGANSSKRDPDHRILGAGAAARKPPLKVPDDLSWCNDSLRKAHHTYCVHVLIWFQWCQSRYWRHQIKWISGRNIRASINLALACVDRFMWSKTNELVRSLQANQSEKIRWTLDCRQTCCARLQF